MKRAAIAAFTVSLLWLVTAATTWARPNEAIIITADSAMLRAAPEADATGLLMVYRGDRLEVLEAKSGWFKVKFIARDYELWVSSQYLKADGTGGARCTGDRVAVRAGGGLNYDIIGRLDYGYAVKVLAERDNWSHIAPLDGATAWVVATDAAPESVVKAVAPATDVPGGASPTPPSTEPGEPGTLAALFDKALADLAAERAKPVSERDLTGIRQDFSKVRTGARSIVLRSRAMRYLEEIDLLMAIEKRQKALEEGRKRVDALLAALAKGDWSAVTGKKPVEPEPIVPTLPMTSGRVEKLAIRISGFTHKLVDPASEDILFLLRSAKTDLASYEGQTAKLTGRILSVAAYPVNGIDVIAIEAGK